MRVNIFDSGDVRLLENDSNLIMMFAGIVHLSDRADLIGPCEILLSVSICLESRHFGGGYLCLKAEGADILWRSWS